VALAEERRVLSPRRRARRVAAGVALVAALLTSAVSFAPAEARHGGDSVVLRWNEAVLQAVRDSRLGPPQVSRALAMVHTCIFDAWAAYDRVAVGTRLGGSLRRPPAERTVPNKQKAVSFAAYRAAVDVFPGSTASFNQLMASLGYDPADTTTDTTTPAGVGNVACQALLDYRHNDGSNQLGNVNGGAPYSDYTGYQPVNEPMDLRRPFDPSTVRDPNRWQPLRYNDPTGASVSPGWLAPHWGRVVPFSMTTPARFRSPKGPARVGQAQFRFQAQDALDMSARLTDTDKAMVEYWADGPKTETPPGHWNLFAQFVSRRDHYSLDRDVKLFFTLNNAVFDAGIVAWDNKRAFDSVRPITAVRHLFRGQQVRAWAGPGRGTQVIDGASWLPYQPSYFPTPPFGEYPSGHSTFSAAAAEALRRVTGSDNLGASVTIEPGSSKVEPGLVPAAPVTLSWPTFTAAADEAGLSRRYGGIHFAQGDLEARRIGWLVGTQVWQKAQSYILGRG
jgi:hypothetical protein